MCTAINYCTDKNCYFGRNLDFEFSYNEEVVVTPKNFPLLFRNKPSLNKHYAIIGMGIVKDNYPLYFDAMNEKGVCIAGLNFPGNADYKQYKDGADNIAPFELIPWILAQCKTLAETKAILENINLVKQNFSDSLPLSPLHFMIADKSGAITVESVDDGFYIYDNPVGVLTNNPAFPLQMFSIKNYMKLSVTDPVCNFKGMKDIKPYSRGMGAMGLPGDLSSQSRFIRAVFAKENTIRYKTEEEEINQFFHILGFVSQPEGCVKVGDLYEKTLYSSCCDTKNGIYYYKTYENSTITKIDMNNADIEGKEIIRYPLIKKQKFNSGN